MSEQSHSYSFNFGKVMDWLIKGVVSVACYFVVQMSNDIKQIKEDNRINAENQRIGEIRLKLLYDEYKTKEADDKDKFKRISKELGKDIDF